MPRTPRFTISAPPYHFRMRLINRGDRKHCVSALDSRLARPKRVCETSRWAMPGTTSRSAVGCLSFACIAASTACARQRRSLYSAEETRAVSSATSNAPDSWRRTGGRHERIVREMGCHGAPTHPRRRTPLPRSMRRGRSGRRESYLRCPKRHRPGGEHESSRKGLYKALSEDGNPTFATVMRSREHWGCICRVRHNSGAIP